MHLSNQIHFNLYGYHVLFSRISPSSLGRQRYSTEWGLTDTSTNDQKWVSNSSSTWPHAPMLASRRRHYTSTYLIDILYMAPSVIDSRNYPITDFLRTSHLTLLTVLTLGLMPKLWKQSHWGNTPKVCCSNPFSTLFLTAWCRKIAFPAERNNSLERDGQALLCCLIYCFSNHTWVL